MTEYIFIYVIVQFMFAGLGTEFRWGWWVMLAPALFFSAIYLTNAYIVMKRYNKIKKLPTNEKNSN